MQVFDNIIFNVLKYLLEGGYVIFLIDVNEEEEFFYISVKDEGIGILKKDVEKVFDCFYRVDKVRMRKFGGIGLGLVIVREMVQVYGGDIWVDSIEGKGMMIIFIFLYKEE